MNIVYFLHKIAVKIIRRFQSLIGITSIGVRAIVVNERNHVLLIRHTYSPGWYLPGGGIKKGENVYDAIVRELLEETGIIVQSSPKLFAIYLHNYAGTSDYPVLFVIKKYEKITTKSIEIAEIDWFNYDALPEDITPGTQRRLDEYFKHRPPAYNW